MASVKRVAGLVATWSTKARAFSAAPGAPLGAPAAALKEAPAAVTPVAATAKTAAPEAASSVTLRELTTPQLVALLQAGMLSPHRLEADLASASRAVEVRRAFVADALARAGAGAGGAGATAGDAAVSMAALPAGAFDTDAFYRSILNTNCEAVIGYVPLPVGVVGPLLVDGKPYYVPMATTEGALVASTNRGCAAIRRAGGATTAVLASGMTRAPLVRVESLAAAAEMKAWLEVPANYEAVAAAFNSTSRFGRLQSITTSTAGRNVYLRFKASTGDAMGMNMITKGVNEALKLLHTAFPSMRVMSLSGNVCTDKKPSAVNWISGRGKSVAAEVRLSGHVLKTVLKTSADAMVELNTAKNLVGSALAGSVGGFNAHASNILTAVFLATGQDAAQNVESSTCLTLMEKDDSITDAADPTGAAGPGIVMTVTMPSVEVGTVGGGTSLPAQGACLDMLGVRGSSSVRPGAHAEQLARVVAAAVLAGELSLMSALTTNDLLSSHMKLNRKHDTGAASHSGARVAGGALPLSDAMASKLREVDGAAHLGFTVSPAAASPAAAHAFTSAAAAAAASSPLTPAGSVPGGAPAGAHPHPLHMGAGAAPAGAAGSHHPGRRYFAAPTSRVSGTGMATSRAYAGAATALARTAASAATSSSHFACPVGADDGASRGWDEPMLSVP